MEEEIKKGFFKRNIRWIFLMSIPFLLAVLFFILYVLSRNSIIGIGYNLLGNLTRTFIFLGIMLIPFFISLKFFTSAMYNKNYISLFTNLCFMIPFLFYSIYYIFSEWHWKFYIGKYLGLLSLLLTFTLPILLTFDFIKKADRNNWNNGWRILIIILGILLELFMMAAIMAMVLGGFN